MSEWRDQEVRNESRSRDRNEWIAETRGSLALDHRATEVYACANAAIRPAEHGSA